MSTTVNEALYSRQLYVLGVAAQLRLQSASVIVSGELSGLGGEILKNIALAGISSITLHDDGICEDRDVQCGGFLFSQQDVVSRKNRATVAMERVREMNPNVAISVNKGEPNWKAFDVVVLVNCSRRRIDSVANLVMNGNTRLIATGMYGVLAYCFCDFGARWEIVDLDGEPVKSGLCLTVTGTEVETELPHGLHVGDEIKLTSSVATTIAKVVTVTSHTAFTVDALGGSNGCYFEQIKLVTELISHTRFSESVLHPTFCNNSFEDPGRPERLFPLLLALLELPIPLTTSHQAKTFSQQFSSNQIQLVAQTCYLRHSPTASFMGGVAGQEVIKAITGKFTPLDQWLIECPNMEFLPLYATLPLQSILLAKQRVLVVGAGALGCELLKHLALLGMCQQEHGGECIVTDPDSIELSNLNRQFLFRTQSVGKNKAMEAAKACREMNPKFNIRAMDLRMNQDSVANVFNDEFWLGIDLVINALDNIPSRAFVDQLCVYYGKPLFESGTLGTKANLLPIIPHLTQSYGSDPVQDDDKQLDIPACTLHAYPNTFEHCLLWSRDAVFERELVYNLNEANQYLQGGLSVHQLQQPDKIQTIRQVIVGILPQDNVEFPFTLSSPNTFADCVQFARLKFNEWFQIKIDLLLQQHPVNELEKEGGKFWSGKRRQAPQCVEFQSDNALHMLFIKSLAKLLALAYSIEEKDEDDVMSILATSSLPNCNRAVGTLPNSIQQDLALLAQHPIPARTITSAQFDKDSELHLDLVWSAACLRANNYSIPFQSRIDSKRVVGRIIPAMATTTAACCGWVVIELLKYVLANAHSIDLFQNGNFNLAVNAFARFQPLPCHSTLWTVWEFQGDLTVHELMIQIANRLNSSEFILTSLFTTNSIALYNDVLANSNQTMQRKITDLYRELIPGDLPKMYLSLVVDGEMDEEELPPVRLRWKT
ncbi:hypothetical protein BASA81_015744 [Batrachochytrium salamandrivorans]|nr:hypothetical protein BASA81_015744 [Batrachochytrium salamandrivorans]